MVFVLMLYNFLPPTRRDILDVFAAELRSPQRVVEINQYPKSFLSCVSYMACMGYYPQDLVSAALQPSMVKMLQTSTYQDIGRELMELDFNVEIDQPAKYKGSRLTPEVRTRLLQHFGKRSRLPAEVAAQKLPHPPITHQERLTMEMEEKLRWLLGGNDKVTTAFILPHLSNPGM